MSLIQSRDYLFHPRWDKISQGGVRIGWNVVISYSIGIGYEFFMNSYILLWSIGVVIGQRFHRRKGAIFWGRRVFINIV